MKNKGFTIIELVIIIAIMGIMVSILSFSASVLVRNESREAAQTFDAMLSACKIMTISGGGESPKLVMTFDYTENKYYAKLYKSDDDKQPQIEELGDKNLNIIYKKTSTPTVAEQIGGTGLIIRFDKETGALLSDVSLIDFNAGYQIDIYPKTGYFELNK